MSVRFETLTAAHILSLQLQPSQHITAGVHAEVTTPETAAAMVASGPGWAAIDADSGEVLVCAGLGEVYGPRHATAWAMLAPGIGAARLLTITRFARSRIAASGYARVDAIVRTGAELAWARAVGLAPAHVLRAFGAAGEDHFLMERIAA